jgi:hypothetical protein
LECLRKAAETKDSEIRKMLGDIADQWIFLADQKAKDEKRQADKKSS